MTVIDLTVPNFNRDTEYRKARLARLEQDARMIAWNWTQRRTYGQEYAGLRCDLGLPPQGLPAFEHDDSILFHAEPGNRWNRRTRLEVSPTFDNGSLSGKQPVSVSFG